MNTLDYLRTFRIGSFAIFDFTVAFLGMALLSPLLSGAFKKVGILIPKKNWVILTLPISILAHLLIGTMTPFTKFFFDPSGHYVVKLVVVGCCVWGAMGIQRIPRS
jgi:hypothetical protein